MRYLVLIAMLFVSAADAGAQEETLFSGEVERGGFGGPVVKYTIIRDQGALMVGGRGGWIINHSLSLGGGGYAVVTEVDAEAGVLPDEGPLDVEFAYGGFEMEYAFDSNSLKHFTLYALIGGGTVRYVKDVGPVTESNEQAGETDFVFVVEPAVCGELNVTPWFRLNASVSYRLAAGVDQKGLENGDVSGVAGTLTLKFGHF
jgi:hypothetical protein